MSVTKEHACILCTVYSEYLAVNDIALHVRMDAPSNIQPAFDLAYAGAKSIVVK